jgi:5-deoxy-glucuronate isomerase
MTGINLLQRPCATGESGSSLRFEPESVDFQYLGFESLRLKSGESVQRETGPNELGLVVLGGRCSVRSSAGSWMNFGGRRTVFDAVGTTLYLPFGIDFTLSGETDCDVALCYSRAEERFRATLITPEQVEIEIRGGGNATRQINHLLKPDFPAHRLLMVEVYTPGGNWSSYPPHKHDIHQPPGEVDLEEIYYYRVDRPEGYALQRVYTRDGRLDETLTVRSGELVLIPEGYHPVVAAHGYNIYYLNALAGSARSMAASDDPDFAWVRNSWHDKDPRVPVVRASLH